MIIDVHAHAISHELANEMARSPWFGLHLEKLEGGGFAHPKYGPLDPLLFDLEGRLKSLEERQVDLQTGIVAGFDFSRPATGGERRADAPNQ